MRRAAINRWAATLELVLCIPRTDLFIIRDFSESDNKSVRGRICFLISRKATRGFRLLGVHEARCGCAERRPRAMSTGATTELLQVVEKGQVDEVAALLGDDVNVADNLGWTPLHEAAASNRDTSVCELLLCRGAHVNQPNEVPSHPPCALRARSDASHRAHAVW